MRALLVSTCLTVCLAHAQPAPSAVPSPLTSTESKAAVDAISKLVTKYYVFPEKREAIVEALRSAQRSGRYDGIDASQLAARLSEDLSSAGHDRHLWVAWSPERYQARLGVKPGTESTALEDELGERSNQGYEELRILDGNVRYIRLTGFVWKKGRTPGVVADVARFLGGGDAAIIDLRDNGGGSGEAVQALISYFLPADNQLLMTFHDGMTGKTQRTHVLGTLSAQRMVGKPLWVLISNATGSAAEEFADHVKEFKLGKLVGRKTAGAANNNTLFPIAPGFLASISVGRPVHAVSQSNWEGTGVAPDIDTPTAVALDQAHLLSLQLLAAKAEGPRLREYEWAIAGAQAHLEPVTLSEEQLKAYAGQYGVRRIRVEHGTLVFQREEREPIVLVPLGPDLFEFTNDPNIRLRFQRLDGRVSGFEMFSRDGPPISAKRST